MQELHIERKIPGLEIKKINIDRLRRANRSVSRRCNIMYVICSLLKLGRNLEIKDCEKRQSEPC